MAQGVPQGVLQGVPHAFCHFDDLEAYPELGAWAAMAYEQARQRYAQPPQAPLLPQAHLPHSFQHAPVQQTAQPPQHGTLVEKRNYADFDAGCDANSKRARQRPPLQQHLYPQ